MCADIILETILYPCPLCSLSPKAGYVFFADFNTALLREYIDEYILDDGTSLQS